MLEELIREASHFGRVVLGQYGSDHRGWHCKIQFDCIPGTDLSAKSHFNHPTPTEAVELALKNAQHITNSIKGESNERTYLPKI